MQVDQLTCHHCGATEVNDIVVRRSGQPTDVFVRCAACGELVACYQLSRFLDHTMEYESFLKSQGPSGGDSGRQWLAEFGKLKDQMQAGYVEALAELAKKDSQPKAD